MLASVTLISTRKTTPNKCSKSTPPLAINYRRNKHSIMPVMSVRDEREKLKRVSPLLITTELPTAWTRKKWNAPGQMVYWQGIASYTCSRVCGKGSLLSY
jgi:hypothetical protein